MDLASIYLQDWKKTTQIHMITIIFRCNLEKKKDKKCEGL